MLTNLAVICPQGIESGQIPKYDHKTPIGITCLTCQIWADY